ncbi:ankyrin repeat protein [Histomonas meleagridis]|uniref:ankyrin repeat protein n=1 Tax=Histomonas meleagridis TaxID=135588 RepID=UPI0035596DFD|nr:ankyrin repeat protein [Histomonas meleagridis]KAH0800925.1 ankyrin repeat protein [Histomonas meleagridis]
MGSGPSVQYFGPEENEIMQELRDMYEGRVNSQVLLEKYTINYNPLIIEQILISPHDIFQPNPQGVYWMQFALHHKSGKENDQNARANYCRFQSFVRSTIKNNVIYDKNSVLQEIILRPFSRTKDLLDFYNSVNLNNLERVMLLVGLGVELDLRRKEDRTTSLMFCAQKNFYDIAHVLLNNYCDPNKANDAGQNSFWIAAVNGHYDLSTLIQQKGGDINQKDRNGRTVLHYSYSIISENYQLFDYLLKAGANPNIKDANENTVQFIAYLTRDDQIAEMIQDNYGGDISVQGANGNTLAHLAMIDGDKSRVLYLIDRRIDINIHNDKRETVFSISILFYDDFDFCQKLLLSGADINTIGPNGGTPFIRVCQADQFRRDKFDFLLNNKCNIDIQNNSREFPISVLLQRQLYNEAQILYDMNCLINDPESKYEPIVIALQQANQYWVEALIHHGANAANNKFPVLLTYMKLPFFNFELVKGMKQWNFVIGAPLQYAMICKNYEVIWFIWENSDESTRVKISAEKDENGSTPLNLALDLGMDDLVNVLIRKGFNVTSADRHNSTPFIKVCKLHNQRWMNDIWKLIDITNANTIDDTGNSALSYCAGHGDINFCNKMFVHGIAIKGNYDSNGIMQAYRTLLSSYKSLLSFAVSVEGSLSLEYQSAKSKHHQIESEVNRLQDDNKRCYNDISSEQRKENPNMSYISSKHSRINENNKALTRETEKLSKARVEMERAQMIYDDYRRRVSTLRNADREDILYNFAGLVRSIDSGEAFSQARMSGGVLDDIYSDAHQAQKVLQVN